MADVLQRFLDSAGRVKTWPAKRANQLLVLQYLAGKFESDLRYSEAQVNDILKQWHTFGDWAIMRRALIDEGLLARKRDGSEYRRVIS